MSETSVLKTDHITAAVAALNGARSAGGAVESDPEQLRQMFFYDAKASAISLVRLLSCFNAARHSSDFRVPASLAAECPANPYSFKLIEGSAILKLLSPATPPAIRGLRYYLIRVQEAVADLLQTPGPGARVSQAHLEIPVEVANAAACFAKVVVNDALKLARRDKLESEVAQFSYLIGLLDDVIGGKGPLWGEGLFLPPRSDFTLRQRRVEINAVANIARDRHEEQILVTNISVGGLGFDGAATFGAGQVVVINLIDFGRILSGTILWRDGLHAGVRLSQPLPQHDPLLSAPE